MVDEVCKYNYKTPEEFSIQRKAEWEILRNDIQKQAFELNNIAGISSKSNKK